MAATLTVGVIRVVAALLVDPLGRALLVRKRDTTRFMQPGGKPEPGETAEEALSRELAEELGLILSPESFERVGTFSAEAANEEGFTVEATVFDAPPVSVPVVVAAELEELIWLDPAAPGAVPLAPLSRDILLPLLAARTRASEAEQRLQ